MTISSKKQLDEIKEKELKKTKFLHDAHKITKAEINDEDKLGIENGI